MGMSLIFRPSAVLNPVADPGGGGKGAMPPPTCKNIDKKRSITAISCPKLTNFLDLQ